ncbi:DNA mismatch repair protein MutS [Methanomicrobiaceae archaeon CYW5]|uniref:DNA mismatch repair protein MutS n=1 Tax=Methanovulcanius yangii TaxID=1789227 RepID=UPI0029CA96B9|nr:DNA mismatch repair protein MutS [Methanovulcanius yangii]MBT8507116.1 DNA mismatch repair protein MutS [Methanovulcanius yangii]
MSKGPTPAMRQFYDMKAQYPGCVLFFQMGDFYETFGEDAELVARELDITLTSRGRTMEGERMPLAGVPIHAGEAYIARLVKKGYRVAVCDQVEDPKKAKGVVKRDVVRVITPGTVIDSAMLHTAGQSYLMGLSVSKKGKRLGLAFLDITTGEFFITSCRSEDAADLTSAVDRHMPSECVVPEDSPGWIPRILKERGVVVTSYDPYHFTRDASINLLCSQFSVASLEGFGCAGMEEGVCAAGGCLAYAKETQKSELSHIRTISAMVPSGTMVLDSITLRNLELVRGIREGSDSTLLAVLDRTRTAMGGRQLRSDIIAPLIDKAGIEERLDALEYLFNEPMQRTSLRESLHRFSDIERIAGRISYGNAGPRDLVTLRDSLVRIPVIRGACIPRGDTPLPDALASCIEGMSTHDTIVSLIASALTDEPPVLVKTGGVIRDGYDPRLDELRSISHSGKDWIAGFQQEERERTGIKSLKIAYNKVFGYYIEVTKANLHLVPPDYIRKQTMSNGERYTLPVLQEMEAKISNAEEHLTAMEAEIFSEIITALNEHVSALQETARNIGRIDVFASLAEVAALYGYVRPIIEDSGRLLISDGRHPVVERSLESGFVPNDAELDTGGTQILIITGANMAGKSTYMREVALICIMAQMGCFVPADQAVIGITDRIFTRVGAFDDLASGQSTFMVEMIELANILNNVTDRSLVILDEIGRGTSTLDGYSIARAVLEYLHGRGKSGPRTLFATHFHEIVEVESDLKRAKNYHFAVRETGSDVIFLRKLIPGATDRSYGIHVARLAGVPKPVSARAEDILSIERTRVMSTERGKTPRYTQMLLIDAPGGVKETTDPVLIELRNLDPDSMTPREALAKLYELQKKAQ